MFRSRKEELTERQLGGLKSLWRNEGLSGSKPCHKVGQNCS